MAYQVKWNLDFRECIRIRINQPPSMHSYASIFKLFFGTDSHSYYSRLSSAKYSGTGGASTKTELSTTSGVKKDDLEAVAMLSSANVNSSAFSPTSGGDNNHKNHIENGSDKLASPSSAAHKSINNTAAGTTDISSTSISNKQISAKSLPGNNLSTGTEDTYNDFNFWRIPPQIIEDEY